MAKVESIRPGGVLEGSFATYPLADLLIGILRGNLSGRLYLSLRAEPQDWICFKDGVPVQTVLPAAGVPLSRTVGRLQPIVESRAAELMPAAASSRQYEENLLVHHGLVSTDDLEELRRESSRDQMVGLFDLPWLRFRFVEGEQPQDGHPLVILEPLPIVFAGLAQAKTSTGALRFLEDRGRSIFKLAETFPTGVDPFGWGQDVEAAVLAKASHLSIASLMVSGLPPKTAVAAVLSLYLAGMASEATRRPGLPVGLEAFLEAVSSAAPTDESASAWPESGAMTAPLVAATEAAASVFADDVEIEEDDLEPGLVVLPRPATPRPVASRPATPRPATPRPVASRPATPRPVASRPATPRPATLRPARAFRESVEDFEADRGQLGLVERPTPRSATPRPAGPPSLPWPGLEPPSLGGPDDPSAVEYRSVEERLLPVMDKTYFQLLRVRPDTPPEQIERAYRFIVRRVEEEAEDPGWRATKDLLTEAYRVLGDPAAAEIYKSLVERSERSQMAQAERCALEAEPKVERAFSLMALGRTGEARYLLAWAAQLDPSRTDIGPLMAMAEHLGRSAQDRAAELVQFSTAFAPEITKNPHDWRIKLCQSVLLAESGDVRSSQAILRAAPDPHHPFVEYIRLILEDGTHSS